MSRDVPSVPAVDVAVDPARLEEGALRVVAALQPDWRDRDLRTEVFTAGLTNKLVLVYDAGNKEQRALVRVYGNNTERLIDRKRELENIVTCSQLGLAPPVFGRFRNGYIYGYVEGRTIGTAGMADATIAPLVARHMARFHAARPCDAAQAPSLWTTIDAWLGMVPERYANPAVDAVFRGFFDMAAVRAEIAVLRKRLAALNSPLVFAHNDLLCNNILYDSLSSRVAFIDYEYAAFNYRGFDIGNHFCEFAGIEEPVDYSLFPTPDFQRRWLRCYLSEANAVAQEDVSDDDVQALFVEANQFALAAHVFWGLWGLVQASISDIHFDYMGYAVVRFEEMRRRWADTLALSPRATCAR